MTPTQTTILSAIRHVGADEAGFFGVVSFHFQNGKVTVVRHEQTLMPEQLNGGKKKNFNDNNKQY